MALPGSRLLATTILPRIGAAGVALALAGSATAAPAEESAGWTLRGWATSWTWNQGLHYGIDRPSAKDSWEAGGGRAGEAMSGLNWYWDRYVRMQLNLRWAQASGGPRPGDYLVLQTRVDLLI